MLIYTETLLKEMSVYDKEYFYNYDAYKKAEQSMPVGMTSYGSKKFDFYEIGFQNGCKAFLFNSIDEAKSFMEFCNFTDGFVKHLGRTNDILERVINESIKRSTDFIEECNRLSDDREYLLFVAPFQLSYEKENPFDDQEIL
jgi:hypothetical protein